MRFTQLHLNLANLRDFGVGTRLKKIYQEQQPISTTVTTRTWVFLTEWTRMIYVVIQVVWELYRVNNDKGEESLPLLVFRRHVVNVIFRKYSKEGRLSLSHLGIRNIPSGFYYDDAKHYQVQSELRRIQNLLKHLRGSIFA